MDDKQRSARANVLKNLMSTMQRSEAQDRFKPLLSIQISAAQPKEADNGKEEKRTSVLKKQDPRLAELIRKAKQNKGA